MILACTHIIEDYPVQATDQLDSDLAKIHSWADNWPLTFNPGKSGSILFFKEIHVFM